MDKSLAAVVGNSFAHMTQTGCRETGKSIQHPTNSYIEYTNK